MCIVERYLRACVNLHIRVCVYMRIHTRRRLQTSISHILFANARIICNPHAYERARIFNAIRIHTRRLIFLEYIFPAISWSIVITYHLVEIRGKRKKGA